MLHVRQMNARQRVTRALAPHAAAAAATTTTTGATAAAGSRIAFCCARHSTTAAAAASSSSLLLSFSHARSSLAHGRLLHTSSSRTSEADPMHARDRESISTRFAAWDERLNMERANKKKRRHQLQQQQQMDAPRRLTLRREGMREMEQRGEMEGDNDEGAEGDAGVDDDTSRESHHPEAATSASSPGSSYEPPSLRLQLQLFRHSASSSRCTDLFEGDAVGADFIVGVEDRLAWLQEGGGASTVSTGDPDYALKRHLLQMHHHLAQDATTGVFDQFQRLQRDPSVKRMHVEVFNTLLKTCVRLKQPEAAVITFDTLFHHGLRPNFFTYVHVIEALLHQSDHTLAFDFLLLLHREFELAIRAWNGAVDPKKERYMHTHLLGLHRVFLERTGWTLGGYWNSGVVNGVLAVRERFLRNYLRAGVRRFKMELGLTPNPPVRDEFGREQDPLPLPYMLTAETAERAAANFNDVDSGATATDSSGATTTTTTAAAAAASTEFLDHIHPLFLATQQALLALFAHACQRRDLVRVGELYRELDRLRSHPHLRACISHESTLGAHDTVLERHVVMVEALAKIHHPVDGVPQEDPEDRKTRWRRSVNRRMGAPTTSSSSTTESDRAASVEEVQHWRNTTYAAMWRWLRALFRAKVALRNGATDAQVNEILRQGKRQKRNASPSTSSSSASTTSSTGAGAEVHSQSVSNELAQVLPASLAVERLNLHGREPPDIFEETPIMSTTSKRHAMSPIGPGAAAAAASESHSISSLVDSLFLQNQALQSRAADAQPVLEQIESKAGGGSGGSGGSAGLTWGEVEARVKVGVEEAFGEEGVISGGGGASGVVESSFASSASEAIDRTMADLAAEEERIRAEDRRRTVELGLPTAAAAAMAAAAAAESTASSADRKMADLPPKRHHQAGGRSRASSSSSSTLSLPDRGSIAWSLRPPSAQSLLTLGQVGRVNHMFHTLLAQLLLKGGGTSSARVTPNSYRRNQELVHALYYDYLALDLSAPDPRILMLAHLSHAPPEFHLRLVQKSDWLAPRSTDTLVTTLFGGHMLLPPKSLRFARGPLEGQAERLDWFRRAWTVHHIHTWAAATRGSDLAFRKRTYRLIEELSRRGLAPQSARDGLLHFLVRCLCFTSYASRPDGEELLARSFHWRRTHLYEAELVHVRRVFRALFGLMVHQGITLDVKTLNELISACLKRKRLVEAHTILQHMRHTFHLRPDAATLQLFLSSSEQGVVVPHHMMIAQRALMEMDENLNEMIQTVPGEVTSEQRKNAKAIERKARSNQQHEQQQQQQLEATGTPIDAAAVMDGADAEGTLTPRTQLVETFNELLRQYEIAGDLGAGMFRVHERLFDLGLRPNGRTLALSLAILLRTANTVSFGVARELFHHALSPVSIPVASDGFLATFVEGQEQGRRQAREKERERQARSLVRQKKWEREEATAIGGDETKSAIEPASTIASSSTSSASAAAAGDASSSSPSSSEPPVFSPLVHPTSTSSAAVPFSYSSWFHIHTTAHVWMTLVEGAAAIGSWPDAWQMWQAYLQHLVDLPHPMDRRTRMYLNDDRLRMIATLLKCLVNQPEEHMDEGKRVWYFQQVHEGMCEFYTIQLAYREKKQRRDTADPTMGHPQQQQQQQTESYLESSPFSLKDAQLPLLLQRHELHQLSKWEAALQKGMRTFAPAEELEAAGRLQTNLQVLRERRVKETPEVEAKRREIMEKARDADRTTTTMKEKENEMAFL